MKCTVKLKIRIRNKDDDLYSSTNEIIQDRLGKSIPFLITQDSKIKQHEE